MPQSQSLSHRPLMAALGLGLGLALHALFGTGLLASLAPRLALSLACAATTLTLGLVLLTGPLGLRRAAGGALAMALALAALAAWASLRFDTPTDLLDSPLACAAFFTLATLPWPFLITAASPEGWRDYPGLFRESWSILVRTGLAVLFTLFLWAILFLSDALLDLAGLDIIGPILDQPFAASAITGAAMGLAVAVVDEIAPLLSPRLLLRLLRLLVPLLLPVTAVFLLALPFAGLASLSRSFSAAATLTALGALLLTLVTSALDEDETHAVQTPLMRLASRGLAGLVLPLGLLALWAVWLRIGQYGLTPERLAGLTTAGILSLYGLVWALALPRKDWGAGLRRANVGLALAQIGVALSWLTVLDPEAISARNQLARARAAAQPDLTIFARLGRPGREALAVLEAEAKADPALAARLATPRAMAPAPADPADLAARIPLSPETAANRAAAQGLLAQIEDYERRTWAEACGMPLPSGAAGCVLAFVELGGGRQALFFGRSPDGGLIAEAFDPETGLRQGLTYRPDAAGAFPSGAGAEAVVAALQAAPPQSRPVPLREIALPEGGVFLAP